MKLVLAVLALLVPVWVILVVALAEVMDSFDYVEGLLNSDTDYL